MSERAVPAPEFVEVHLRRPLGPSQSMVLKLRRPTAADIRPAPMRLVKLSPKDREAGKETSATWDDFLSIAASCAGLKLEDLGDLVASDVVKILGTITAFLNFDRKAARTALVEVRGSITRISLGRPFMIGGESRDFLELPECTSRHLRGMPVEPSIADFLDLASRMTTLVPALIDRLDIEDALILVEVCAGFFEDSQGTGG